MCCCAYYTHEADCTVGHIRSWKPIFSMVSLTILTKGKERGMCSCILKRTLPCAPREVSSTCPSIVCSCALGSSRDIFSSQVCFCMTDWNLKLQLVKLQWEPLRGQRHFLPSPLKCQVSMSPRDNLTACLRSARPGWSKCKTLWSTNYRRLEIVPRGRRKTKGLSPYYLTAKVHMHHKAGYRGAASLVNTQTSIPTCRLASVPPPSSSVSLPFLSLQL